MPSVTDQLLIMHSICCDSFSFLQQLCTADNGIFYIAAENNFLLVNKILCLSLQTFILKQCLSG